MSISTTLSIWNDVEIARLGANRSIAHSSTACGSSPSNSIESSPASSSSISSTLLILSPLSCSNLGRLEAGKLTQLLVARATREGRKGLARLATVEPSRDQPFDRDV